MAVWPGWAGSRLRQNKNRCVSQQAGLLRAYRETR